MRELARRADTTPATISRLCAGRAQPSAAVLVRLALALGVRVEDFYVLPPEPKEQAA